MASSFAVRTPRSVPHIPHIPVQHAPHIPGTRYLKGEPRNIDIPQPEGPVPEDHKSEIWVQGRWRSRASNATRDRKKVMSQQVKKALAQKTHGCSIYAYYHLKSKQVVYSTSRIMEPGQILPQLVFHGKKTVPAGLRRDMWRPYFSIHFPQTDRGKAVGLTSYQRLREFALRRQMSPEPGSLLATQEDVDRAIRQGGNPFQIRQLFESKDHRKQLEIPVLGNRLSKQLRAHKLMNQKATAVADVAFVLGLAVKPLQDAGLNLTKRLADKDAAYMDEVGRRARRTLLYKREQEEIKAQEIEKRAQLINTVSLERGNMPLDHKIAKRMALEHDGAISGKENRVVDMQDIPNREMHDVGPDPVTDIQILWADMRDGTYAQDWPEGVFHGELQPLALEKKVVRQIVVERDAEGNAVSRQVERKIVVAGKTVHVHGGDLPVEFRTYGQLLLEQKETRERTLETRREEEEQWAIVRREREREMLESEPSEAQQAREQRSQQQYPEQQQTEQSGPPVMPYNRGMWASVKGLFKRS